ncbi:hypothetical protein [Pseudomonas sp. UBA2047]|uniref:hypothetical protein n=1 Tax=Pseudomonas sp. UBA2047 TaxID=1947306 RepID=UPI00257E4071|nr:hypothetical protein [Pseudomonas sp. UBA2047]
MLRIAAVVTALVVIGGCASGAGNLYKYGQPGLDGNYLKSLEVSGSGPAAPGKMAMCTASTIKNDPVSLRDSSRTFVGAYTGNYYQAGSNREVGGGGVIQYVTPDESSVVAKGETGYTSAMVSRSVRYTVTIKNSGPERKYLFTGIQQAQLDTGSMVNAGYSPVHVMMGGGSEDVARSLSAVAEEIETCIR